MSDAARMRERAKSELLSVLEIIDSALDHRETAYKLLDKNRSEIQAVQNVSQETWAKVLWVAAAPYESGVEWAKAAEKAKYRAMGAAIVAELKKRFSVPEGK